jgi:hypothetical protein
MLSTPPTPPSPDPGKAAPSRSAAAERPRQEAMPTIGLESAMLPAEPANPALP